MPNKSKPPVAISGRLEIKAASPSGVAELLVYGDIGENWDGRSIAAIDVVRQLALTDAKTIIVRINSYGGSCSDGLAIYNALKRHPAKIEVTIDGVAASIASVIAMAGDTITMPANTWIMVHAPWQAMYIEGNARQLQDATSEIVERLELFAQSLAQCYASKTGRPLEEMLELVEDGVDHFMTAEQAFDLGFCDVVLEDSAAVDSARAAMRLMATQPEFTRVLSALPGAIAASFRNTSSNDGNGRGEIVMPKENTDAVTAAARDEIVAAERKRVQDIRAAAAPHIGSADISDIVEAAVADGSSVEAAGKLILAALGRESAPTRPSRGSDAHLFEGSAHPTATRTGEAFIEAASDVLAVRAGVKIDKPHAGVRDIQGMSISDMARACLSRAGGRGLGDGASAVIRNAMTTSDFPAILENTMRKSLRRGYEDEPGTHAAWIRRTTVPDFRAQSRAILASMPGLSLVLEGAEYTYGSVDEDKSVPFAIEKFGKLIGVTWEALINDNLNALGRIPQGLGQAARRKEADLVYSIFNGSGQLMQDGKALFHVDHGNLAIAAAALDEASLASARLLMRKQLAFGGGALNLAPRTLLVPPELESAAEKVIAASSIHVGAGLESATPEWIRNLQLVVEARLPADAFYVLASSNQVDTAELAYLEGHGGPNGGPEVLEERGFDRDVQLYKVRAPMGVRALDWRGFAKVPITP